MKILWMVAPQIDYGPGGAMELLGISDIWASWLELAPTYDELWLSLEMHPADHISFAAMHPWRKPGQSITFQGQPLTLTITHCVGGSFGAMLSPEFHELEFAKTFHFGTQKMSEVSLCIEKEDSTNLSISDDAEIHLLGVNHLPIFDRTITHLKSLDINALWLDNKSLSPVSEIKS